MIRYHNRGISLLFALLRMSGSVLPRSARVALVSAAWGIFVTLYKDSRDGSDKWMNSSFSGQAFSTLVGFCVVYRTSMALSRYNAGCYYLRVMATKWLDVYAMLGAFANESVTSGCDAAEMLEWRKHLAHCFSLMSACATFELRHDVTQHYRVEISDLRAVELMVDPLPSVACGRLSDKSDKSRRLSLGKDVKQILRKSWTGGYMKIKKLERREKNLPWPLDSFWHNEYWPWHTSEVADESLGIAYYADISKDERDLLDQCSGDKVILFSKWIQESIMVKYNSGALVVPTPILSRVFQELSVGMFGYAEAVRIALVPFPYPFAQMLTGLLVTFCVFSPVLVQNFTDSQIFGTLLTFIIVYGYWGLNEIAVELENPFGDDMNDLPLVGLHTEFLGMLEEILMNPSAQICDYRITEMDS